MKVSKILVPVDFSPFSEYATKYALHFAEKFHASITLLHVIVLYEADADEEKQIKQLEEIIKRKEENTQKLIDQQHQKIDPKKHKIDSKVIRGISAANSILEFIDENDYDIVVMGTHGRTGIKNWIYGSVAEKVVRLSQIPVLTVHQRKKQEIDIKKIVVPIDFSENSKKGIQSATNIAKEFNAQIEFLHIIEQQLHPSFHVVGIESIFAINPDLKVISTDKLKEFCKTDIEAVYTVLEGIAHQTIADYTKDIDADLIVMSTRGFSGLDHLLIGSTTERVVRIAHCPVLTVGRGQ